LWLLIFAKNKRGVEMSVKTYSLKKDGEKNITKNFKVKEFKCNDGSDKILISTETVNIFRNCEYLAKYKRLF
jgi:hypothetical protein